MCFVDPCFTKFMHIKFTELHFKKSNVIELLYYFHIHVC